MASGLRPEERLKKGGLEAKAGRVTKVWIGHIDFAPGDHALVHPRATEAPDDALVKSIVDHGFFDNEPISVYEETQTGGGKKLYVIDGSRRTNAGKVAEGVLREKGQLKKEDPRLFVPITIFDGTIEQALASRIRADSDPLKKPHSLSVLCATFRPLSKFGWSDAAIAEAHGRKTATQVGHILRFETLPEATRAAFDAGLPDDLLAMFLDEVAPADHPAAIAAALAAGGAAKPRAAKKAARKATGEDMRRVSRPSALHVAAVYKVIGDPVLRAFAGWVAGQDDLSAYPEIAKVVVACKPKAGRKTEKAQEVTA